MAEVLVDGGEGLTAAAADLAEVDGWRGHDAVHLAGAPLIEAEILTSADGARCEVASGRGLHIANPLDG